MPRRIFTPSVVAALLGSCLAWGSLALRTAAELRADPADVQRQLARSQEAYANVVDWAARRAELQETFLRGAGLWPLPTRQPPAAIRHGLREYADYSVENVALETLPGFYLTGNLYRPLQATRATPIVLCPDGHYRPHSRFRDDQQVRCAHLARMGATVFSYSMVGWDDSTQTTHDDPLVLALQTWNSLRAVDWLVALPGVNPHAIAVTGSSGGGTQAIYLALIDERVTVCAPVAIVYPWAAPEGCLCEGGLPIMQTADTNIIELAAALAPRPQLVISVGLLQPGQTEPDPTHDFPQTGLPFLARVYEQHGARDALQTLHLPEEGHDFGPTKRAAVYAFLAERWPDLRLLEEDQAAIALETPEQLQAFTAEHPLPAHAIQGSAAVAAAWEQGRARVEPQVDELALFTPPGQAQPGAPRTLVAEGAAQVAIRVLDAQTGQPTTCRINVLGPDGNYYQPAENRLTPFALTGQWPEVGQGNRAGKCPARYYGRYFYSTGVDVVAVPPGDIRIEVAKGFEYAPRTQVVQVAAGQTVAVEIVLERTADAAAEGYYNGDPHLHFPRRDAVEEQLIFDLLSAEDIRYGSILAYNEPAGPYRGLMPTLAMPQREPLGYESVARRGPYTILSGQEYRSGTYGHLNLFGRSDLVLSGADLNADNWPWYGDLARETQRAGGYAIYAHGGYAQAIYADCLTGDVNAVELLQFGVYRGIGLADWYNLLNVGFRFPCVGASDYPACRALGDCRTYVWHDEEPTFGEWLHGAALGRSFVSTGPLLLLEVAGQRPGARLASADTPPGAFPVRIRLRCEVAPLTHVQLVVGGEVARHWSLPARAAVGEWVELTAEVAPEESTWIAARAFSTSHTGAPDAESHTNPVYVYRAGKAPYSAASAEAIDARLQQQIATHRGRNFPEQGQILERFEQARAVLARIRAEQGMTVDVVPDVHPLTDEAAAPAPQEAAAEPAFDPSARTHTPEQLREYLRPVPALPPAEAAQTFATQDGFTMQLVAAEPLVVDPVAAAFDEDGHLYVCEMRDYPYAPQEGAAPLGTIRVLHDTDGDGAFDQSDVFATELLWAAGVACYRGGVYVAAPPDIWYLRDTDGDWRADEKRRVFSGFGLQNQQGMLNNLAWGLDHRMYGSTSVNGGQVVSHAAPGAPAVDLAGRDFRFSPLTERIEPVTGTVQFGNAFDDWGNRFLCSESAPLLHAVLPYEYLLRNPYLPVPYALKHLTELPVPCFRISPIERWREIRSARRIAHGERAATSAGASHHVIDAAAGPVVYRGGAYPAELYGQIFVSDAQNNLIHRRRLIPDGASFQSVRIDEQTEFVRSSDNWFRPVNLLNAPDGTLYVLDMSREILESIHIPSDVVEYLDLASGRDNGRIYRLAPPGFTPVPPPRLGSASTAELVQTLASPHAWQRETAHRLLFERQDAAAVPLLRALFATEESAPARLHALWSLSGLAALEPADVLAALRDAAPGVREHALALAEEFFDSPDVLAAALPLVGDPEFRVRFQAAFSLGESDSPAAATALVDLARREAGDAWMRTAILSSATNLAEPMLAVLLASAPGDSGQAGELLDDLAMVLGARGDAAEIGRALDLLASAQREGKSDLARALLLALAESYAAAGRLLDPDAPPAADWPRGATGFLRDELLRAESTLAERAQDAVARITAARLLACCGSSAHAEALLACVSTQEPVALQLAVLQALGRLDAPQIAEELLSRWAELLPEVRAAALSLLLSREAWTRALLAAVAAGTAQASELDAGQRAQLASHSAADIAAQAQALFAAPPARQAVIEQYTGALAGLTGDAERGREQFKQHCAACHRLGDAGHVVGPDLTSSANRDPAALLAHILDPNRYVLPRYVQYAALDDGGRVYTGVIAAQTATSVTLRRDQGQEDVLLLGNLETLAASGKSLMPEGLEQKLPPPAMADLIAYLLSVQSAATTPPPLDIGTEPGLVEPQ